MNQPTDKMIILLLEADPKIHNVLRSLEILGLCKKYGIFVKLY